jgi:limonene-1,2-epoxide hydrolase
VPWFPDFVNAVQLARRQQRTAEQTDAVTRYVIALQEGNAQALESAWPEKVEVADPRAGRVWGHEALTAFVERSQNWLAGYDARVETVAETVVEGRAVVEILAHLSRGPHVIDWPVAIVAESVDDRSVAFRTYCSLWDVDGRRRVRSPILQERKADLPQDVSRLLVALAAGDVGAVVGSLAPAAYVREAGARGQIHRGALELHAYFTDQFAGAGSIRLEPCVTTDDGLQCAVEFNCTRWGAGELPPQPGVGIFERHESGPITGVRLYHDIEILASAAPATPRASSPS